MLVDAVEELAKFHAPVAAMALADHFATGDIERRGKQRGGAIAEVVGTALGLAGPHRQDRLHPIELLDLRLLVGAQDQGPLRRIEIKPYNIAHLLHQLRIVGKFEGFGTMRTQAESAPDPAYRHPADTAALGHLAGASVSSTP